MNFKLFIYVIIISFVISCQRDNPQNIDAELIEAINTNSAGEGLAYFELPDANQWGKIPQDPANPLTAAKVELGKLLFHETAFSTDGLFPITKQSYSCASCHHVDAGFQAGIAQGIGEGGEGFGHRGEGRQRNTLCEPEKCDVQPIRSPSILNGAWQEIMLWNGQFGAGGMNVGTEAEWTEDTPKAINLLGFQGLETQAIAGLKVHRIDYSKETVDENGYTELFDEAFPDIDEEERYNRTTAGLAIAAYERIVVSNRSPWQRYLKGELNAMTESQKRGAMLFLKDGQCVSCHTGPALNSMSFHALGMKEFDVNAVTHYNVDDPAQFGRFSFTKKEEDRWKFKTPQLYNLADVDLYGHGASMRSIRQVIDYKNKAIRENVNVPIDRLSPAFRPLKLSDEEINDMVDFIKYALYDPELDRYVPEILPTGLCFPNNDEVSQFDLGCE